MSTTTTATEQSTENHDNPGTAPGADMATVTAPSTIEEIRRLHGQIWDHARTTLENALLIGELLIAEKGRLHHGKWTAFVKNSLPFDERTARRYMQVYHDRHKLKTDTVSDLMLSKAYALLRKPKQSKSLPLQRQVHSDARIVPTEIALDQLKEAGEAPNLPALAIAATTGVSAPEANKEQLGGAAEEFANRSAAHEALSIPAVENVRPFDGASGREPHEHVTLVQPEPLAEYADSAPTHAAALAVPGAPDAGSPCVEAEAAATTSTPPIAAHADERSVDAAIGFNHEEANQRPAGEATQPQAAWTRETFFLVDGSSVSVAWNPGPIAAQDVRAEILGCQDDPKGSADEIVERQKFMVALANLANALCGSSPRSGTTSSLNVANQWLMGMLTRIVRSQVASTPTGLTRRSRMKKPARAESANDGDQI